ncbi:MAG: tRNA (adenosine(37)-N6)-dimethylallyltransferase MiaA [Gammaproteobacteria bacterium]|nr:tRNA (adenosine(37)-N6)-dimethylallyltransferase MiaA [Gammaproteobacteria bacterium]
MGATAAGKTALALEIIKKFPCEIISVDSALIYKGLDIGTAKPTAEELEKAPHFLVDIVEPSESYSAWEFRRDALRLMDEITRRGNIPLLVGGTMLYFNALEYGMDDLPQSDEKVRQALVDQLNADGLEVLYEQLQKIDEVSAQKIKATDKQRILRALEVFQLTGKPLSSLQTQKKEPTLKYNVLKLILAPEDRTLLHQRISLRYELMLEQGFVNEVKALKSRDDLSLDKPSMRCVGYRQVWEYLQGDYDFALMVEKACAATRQLAKRQVTWLRKQQNAQWFDSDHINTDGLLNNIEEYLTKFKN